MEGRRSNSGTRRPWWALAVRGASGLAVASAVSAAAAADGPRAAVLLPPRLGAPAPAPIIARGAADDDALATTPVVRKSGSAPLRPLVPPSTGAKTPAPDWLSGVDPNVVPAGGNVPSKGGAPIRLGGNQRNATALPPAGSPKLAPPPPLFHPGDAHPLAKGVDAMKGFVAPDAAAAQPDTRSPGDALQGKAANGAPVLAGPPAWRWYGYGSVTPGANAYAPTGQYPRASSNWYSVTRATPGAFPVPVVAPFRGAPGSEPPSYAGTPPAPTRPATNPAPVESVSAPPSPRFNPAPTTPPVFNPLPGTKINPAPVAQPAAALPPPVVPIPTMTPPPVAVAPIPLPPPPSLMPLPLPTPVPIPVATAEPPPAPRPMTAPPVLPPLSVLPVATVTNPAPTTAAPPAAVPSVALPTIPSVAPAEAPAVTPNEIRWQSNPTHNPGPPAGTWIAPTDRARPAGQPGASLEPRRIIARGQIGDDVQEPADPVADVVNAVCRGRATGIDVRHTGPRRVTVCFEARTQTDATALVRDLSARPELSPYEINFCVLVK